MKDVALKVVIRVPDETDAEDVRNEVNTVLGDNLDVSGAWFPVGQLTEIAAPQPGTSTVHMRIIQDNELIADLPDWPHPVPRIGEYILHPPSDPEQQHELPGVAGYPGGVAGCVRLVMWRTHDRSADPEATAFVMTAHPYVELAI